MNISNIEKRSISVREAARIMGKHEQFVRIGLQKGILPFGVAEKLPNSSRWSYHISPKARVLFTPPRTSRPNG